MHFHMYCEQIFDCPSAQWSEGVTKPPKLYSQIVTAWDFLISFWIHHDRILELKQFLSLICVSFDAMKS